MALLDTFTILFDTDATEASDEAKKLDDQLGKTEKSAIDAGKGMDKTSVAAMDSADSMSVLTGEVANLIAAYISWQAISETVFGQALATDEIGKFSETLGFNIEQVDSWGAAVSRNGGTLQGFMGTIEGVNSQLNQLTITGNSVFAQTLARMGISATNTNGQIKDTFDILLDVSDAFQTMSTGASVEFGRMLGLDQGTILTLQQGRAATLDLVESQRRLGGRTEEGYKVAARFNDEIDNTKRVFVGMSDTASQTILPVLSDLLVGFQDIALTLSKHGDLMKGALLALGIAAAALAAPFVILAAKIGLVVAAGAAFALAFDDVSNYMKGNKSLIGELAQEYEWFGKLVDAIISGVKFQWETLSEFGSEMLTNLQIAFQMLGSMFGDVGVDMTSVVDTIIAAFSLLGDAIRNTLEFIASPIEQSKALFESAKDFFGFGGEDQVLNAVQNIQTAPTPSNYITGNAPVSNNTSSYTFGNVNVDARGMNQTQAQEAVQSGITGAIAAATNRLNTGVKR